MDLGQAGDRALRSPAGRSALDRIAIHDSAISSEWRWRQRECRLVGLDAADRRPERLGQNAERSPAGRIWNSQQRTLERSVGRLAQRHAARTAV